MKALTAALMAAVLAIGMAACNRDNNAGSGSSANPDQPKRSSSAAGGSSAPSSPTAPSRAPSK